MTYRIIVDEPLGVVFTVASGNISLDETRRHRRDLNEHPAFVPTMRHLLDLRRASFSPDGGSIRRLISEDPFAVGSKRALLVSSDLMFGMGRMYSMLAESVRLEFEPFRSLPEACDWLGIPEASARKVLEAHDELP